MSANAHARRGFHNQMVPRPKFGERLDVARVVAPKVKVLAHHHSPGVQPADQNLGDKSLRRQVGEIQVEGNHKHLPDALLTQQRRSFADGG